MTASGPYERGTRGLVTAVQELSRARDLETVQRIVRRAARELTGADGATFILPDGDLCFYADEDAIAPLWKGRRFPRENCISGWSMQHGRTAVIEDIYEDERIPQDAYRPTFVRSLVMVPIRAATPLGAIGTYWADRRVSTSEEVELLSALADSTAVALEHIRLLDDLEQRVADRTAEVAERMERLRRNEEQRRLLAAEALGAEERERARLSETLHDDVLQWLLTARQELPEVASGDKDAIVRARAHLDRVTRHIRDLLIELSPLTVQLSMLSDAVRSIVRTQTDGKGWMVEADVDEHTVSEHAPLVVRAARELLVNVAKHARAASVAVSLRSSGGEAILTVTDDGVGFDVARLEQAVRDGHIGLASLASRAEAAGGSLGVTSSGAGTEVTLRVPAGTGEQPDSSVATPDAG
ncbi:MAG: hypothetical protein QOF29_3182 [bacterium]